MGQMGYQSKAESLGATSLSKANNIVTNSSTFNTKWTEFSRKC